MANLKFYKKSTEPAGIATGGIWFDTTEKAIKIKTDSGYDVFAGKLSDATLTGNLLTISKADGSSVQVNFSDMASASQVAAKFEEITVELAKKVNNTVTVTGTDGLEGGGALSGNVSIKHKKSSAAAVTSKFAKITTDSYGHITGTADVTASDITPLLPVEPTYLIERVDQNVDSEYSAVYQLTKDGQAVGVPINIPKDMVVRDGKVKDVNGVKTIVLTIANGDDLEIPVGSLVDIYNSGAGITVNGTTRDISVNLDSSAATSKYLAVDSTKGVYIKPSTRDGAPASENAIDFAIAQKVEEAYLEIVNQLPEVEADTNSGITVTTSSANDKTTYTVGLAWGEFN